MSKNKLTKNQKRRIEKNKARTLADYSQRTKSRQHDWQEEALGEIQEGRVVARYSLHADVESLKGSIFRCNLRRTVSDVVVGDYVLWREGNEVSNGINGVIEVVKPRYNVLSRPDYYDGIKSIAANIDRIFIVSSVLPQFSTNIIDRYIVVCEQLGITPIIIVNKIDLCTHFERQTIEEILSIYQKIGYQTVLLSSKTKENFEQFTALLINQCSILVGQSGVGKSSLLNTVDPKLQLQTGDVSSNSGLGQHTTTVSRLLKLACGGEVIDSPGVREFGLWHLDAEMITRGYREFHPYLGQCKFRDCKHLDDPGCALQSAVRLGIISTMRFENYHRLIIALEENRARRHFSTR